MPDIQRFIVTADAQPQNSELGAFWSDLAEQSARTTLSIKDSDGYCCNREVWRSIISATIFFAVEFAASLCEGNTAPSNKPITTKIAKCFKLLPLSVCLQALLSAYHPVIDAITGLRMHQDRTIG